jgi:hypothetical protein
LQEQINPDDDTEIVIERLKSGDVPPGVDAINLFSLSLVI